MLDDGFRQFLILRFVEVDAIGVHCEHRLPLKAVPILGAQVEVQVVPVVSLCAVVDFVRVEGRVQGFCHMVHVIQESLTFLIG